MSQSDSNNNKPSKLNNLLEGKVDQSLKARLPRSTGAPPLQEPATSAAVSEPEPRNARLKFGPAFWTIASIMSLSVNIVLLAIGLLILRMLGGLTFVAEDQASGILGGLYHNFVKMDQATISANVPVDAVIPLNIVVPVQATTRITLAEDAFIPNAHVRINTGELNIDADAEVLLPANTPLVVNLDFPLTVQNSIPIHLDVAVNIPLSQTQLHEPFVGLQKVVEPFYCFVEPNTVINGINVCSPIADIQNNPNNAEQIVP